MPWEMVLPGRIPSPSQLLESRCDKVYATAPHASKYRVHAGGVGAAGGEPIFIADVMEQVCKLTLICVQICTVHKQNSFSSRLIVQAALGALVLLKASYATLVQ